MVQNRILALADDLTGALEVGAKFRLSRINTLVHASANAKLSPSEDGITAFVIDAETRHLDGMHAGDRIRELLRAARHEHYQYIYKKTDSTLRGNIGSELGALAGLFPQSPIVYAPAYPLMGRTVKNGVLYVRGEPVSETSFGGDRLNPVHGSNIVALLSTQCSQRIVSGGVKILRNPIGAGIMVCDAETDSEVEAIARAFAVDGAFKIAAGPSAFALHLANFLVLPRLENAVVPKIRSCLIVNGSLHPVSIAQINEALVMGFEIFKDGKAPSGSNWLVLKQKESAARASLDFARRIGTCVVDILRRVSFDALVIFGGDTAYGVVEALGNPQIYPLGDLMEGVPISAIHARDCAASLGHRNRDLTVITKAGGYGPPNLLSSIRTVLRGV
jgi:D-threonate/D-erythronate kinase